MNNIVDLIIRLPASIGVSLSAAHNRPDLYTLRDIMYHLQMSYYWLKQANEEFKVFSNETLITSGEEEEHKLIIPSYPDLADALKYLKDELTKLGQDTWDYSDSAVLPHPVKYKIDQGYNNIMLALFNTEISTMYYEQLTGGEPQFRQ